MTDEFIGKTIGGYEILSQIGKGGMATVYCARQTSMNRVVALKVLPREMMKDDSYLARFKREVAIVAQLEHRNIVPVYDHDDYEGQPYIAMRYMKGGSLDALLNDGPMPIDRVIKIISQIAPALDYAHSKGVLHRDLKPSNILIDDDGGFYITDFGIARILNADHTGATLTTQGVLGTPSYMSPEQAQGQPMDGRSDVYSLGVMLFEMATGRRPFYSDTPYSVAVMQVTAPPPSPRSLNPRLGYAVEQVIFKALKKTPEERYQTAQDLAEALRMAVEAPASSLHDTQPRPLNVRAALEQQATQESMAHSGTPAQQMFVPPVQQPLYTPTPGYSQTPQPSRPLTPVSPSVRARKVRRKSDNMFAGMLIGGLIGCGMLAVIVMLMILAVNYFLNGSTPEPETSSPTSAVTEDEGAAVARATLSATMMVNTTAIPTRSATLAPIAGSLGEGQVLYFAEEQNDTDTRTFAIFRGTLGSGSMLRLTNDGSNSMYPSASPDGQRIAFQSDRSGSFDLYAVNSVGGELRRLTNTAYDEVFPSWSPDGEWIVYSADVRGDGTYDLYRVRPDGSDAEEILSTGERLTQPRWSPSGDQIVFTIGAPRDASTWDIALLDMNTREITRLTENDVRDAWPVFSPDGDTITFVTGNAGMTSLARVSATGGSANIIHSAEDFIWSLTYTPDGEHLVFNAGEITSATGAIYAIDADGGVERQRTNINGGQHIIWTR